MSHSRVLLFLSFLAVCSALSVLSFNTQACTGLDRKYDIARTAQAINAINPDLVGLQELDNMTQRHPGDNQLAKLSELTGLKYFVYGKVLDFQGGGYGIGILSRFPILESKLHIYKTRTEEPRGILVAKVNDFWFATTHIGLKKSETNQTIEMVEILKQYPRFIVVGDFNQIPLNDGIKYIYNNTNYMDSFVTCETPSAKNPHGYTFPSGEPHVRIDYQFSDAFKCKTSTVVDTQASDHRPLHVVY